MAEQTKIEWTDATFNPWWGCDKVSPGCKFCYAEAWAKRTGHKVWGGKAPRRLFGEKHWAEPVKWARQAAALGLRRRVFCASMADVFEDHPLLTTERAKLWVLIRQTFFTCKYGCDWTDKQPEVWMRSHSNGKIVCRICDRASQLGGLDWLLLTKRPENVMRMIPADILPLVWIGATTEDPKHAAERIAELHEIPARVRFLSAEPLLEGLNLTDPIRLKDGSLAAPLSRIQWVIVGGESGHGARPFNIAWARAIVHQCRRAGVACFVKQMGANPFLKESLQVDEHIRTSSGRVHAHIAIQNFESTVSLNDAKGGDWTEWPADLRVREFPESRR